MIIQQIFVLNFRMAPGTRSKKRAFREGAHSVPNPIQTPQEAQSADNTVESPQQVQSAPNLVEAPQQVQAAPNTVQTLEQADQDTTPENAGINFHFFNIFSDA